MPAFLLSVFKVLRIQIGLPLGVILSVGVWAEFDKSSAVRRAVDGQVNEFVSMVAQEQLAEVERRRMVAVGALKTSGQGAQRGRPGGGIRPTN